MDTRLLGLLICPICHGMLHCSADQKQFICAAERPHTFDVAKSGYLNLTGGRRAEGDAKDAVRARRTFLDAGYYEPLSNRINEILNECGANSVLDAGCGEGYYSNRMATEKRVVLGVDLSKDGIDLAAKSAKVQGNRAGFVVASLFMLPVRSASVDAITNLFAPCAEEEFLRVLAPGGYFILVGAGEKHLFGLKEAIYRDPYLNTGREDLPQAMAPLRTEHLRYQITVSGQEHIQALFSMTPYYWRTSESDRKKLAALTSLTTEVDFDIFIYRKGQTP